MSFVFARPLLAAPSFVALLMAMPALAQSPAPLPELKVEARRAAPPARTRTTPAPRRAAAPAPRPVATPAPATRPAATPPASLTAPGPARARAEAARVPGAVAVVSDTDYKEKQAATVKDVLDYVPGVFAQPKWGDDTRLSIRGSGLSRNFHLRGIQLYLDGMPINTADGYGDFHEIDPSAYRLVQVFKGGNALALGANTYGGAINFVTPSGYDAARAQASLTAGSFGFHRAQASSGGVHGAWDYFITLSHQQQDGYREHSQGRALRGSANLGYRFNENAETRFYLNASHVRQRIPGEVNEFDAVFRPRVARFANVLSDQQRNIDTFRIGNRTTLKFDATTLEFGAFYLNRHLMHPIFQWLDYKYDDYGAFAKVTDERMLGGFRNRFTAGITQHNGATDARQYANLAGAAKGALLSWSRQTSRNTALYAENAFYLRPDLSLVVGAQGLLASRQQEGRLAAPSFSRDFISFNPKVGLVYDVRPNWQLFANLSRASEVPSFSETLAGSLNGIRPQKALSVELGTRGREERFSWDVALYRARLKDEFQCLGVVPGSCTVTNVPKTIHQGIEAGFGAVVWQGLAGKDDKLWLNAAYTLNDFRFDNNPAFGNNVLPGVPRHVLKAELMWRHPSGFSFGPNVEWAPEAFYQDNANTRRGTPYALLGLRAAYDAGKWSAFVEGKNLTDKRYVASASVSNAYAPGAAVFNPGNGLSVHGGVNVTW